MALQILVPVGRVYRPQIHFTTTRLPLFSWEFTGNRTLKSAPGQSTSWWRTFRFLDFLRNRWPELSDGHEGNQLALPNRMDFLSNRRMFELSIASERGGIPSHWPNPSGYVRTEFAASLPGGDSTAGRISSLRIH